MAVVFCPRCSAPNVRSGFPLWVILVAIFAFPLGLLALAAGRRPTQCNQCGFLWQA